MSYVSHSNGGETLVCDKTIRCFLVEAFRLAHSMHNFSRDLLSPRDNVYFVSVVLDAVVSYFRNQVLLLLPWRFHDKRTHEQLALLSVSKSCQPFELVLSTTRITVRQEM